MPKTRNAIHDIIKFRKNIGQSKNYKHDLLKKIPNISDLINRLLNSFCSRELEEPVNPVLLSYLAGLAIYNIFQNKDIGKNLGLLFFYLNILLPALLQSASAFETFDRENSFGLVNNIDHVEHDLMYQCHKSESIQWQIPSQKILLQSMVQTAKCNISTENYWADVMEIILYRTLKAGKSVRNNLTDLSQISYSKLPSHIKKDWRDKVLIGLIASSATASGLAEQQGRTENQTMKEARQGYLSAFDKIQKWVDEQELFTKIRFKQLHQLLDNSGNQFRKVNGGHPYANFVDHHLIDSILENLSAWLNHPNKDLHPFEIALIAQQIFISAHPFNNANGRISMLLTNWILMKYDYPPIAYSYNELKSFGMWSSLSPLGLIHVEEIFTGHYTDQGVHALSATPGIFFQARQAHHKTWASAKERVKYYREQESYGRELLGLINSRTAEAIGILKENLPNISLR